MYSELEEDGEDEDDDEAAMSSRFSSITAISFLVGDVSHCPSAP
jgi:hypothetical protein